MKLVILSLFVVADCAIDRRFFRFKNGSGSFGEREYGRIEGTMQILSFSSPDGEPATDIYFGGMIMSSLTPIIFWSEDRIEYNGKAEYKCKSLKIGRQEYELGGFATLEDNRDNATISGKCITASKELIQFNMDGKATKNHFYAHEEAGLRAKYLLGQSSERYKASEVVGYAIYDDAYIYQTCSRFFSPYFPNATGPAPGNLILGKDGNHCAIFDNEGTKFIHSNPIKKVVTIDSIALLNTYFPSGVIYKGSPDRLIIY